MPGKCQLGKYQEKTCQGKLLLLNANFVFVVIPLSGGVCLYLPMAQLSRGQFFLGGAGNFSIENNLILKNT